MKNKEIKPKISAETRNAHFELSDRKAYEAFELNPDLENCCPFQYYYENRLRIQCPFSYITKMKNKDPYCLQCPLMLNVVGKERHVQEEYAEIENVKK